MYLNCIDLRLWLRLSQIAQKCLLFFFISVLLSACSVLTPEPAWKKAVEGDGPGKLSMIEGQSIQVSNLPKSRSGNRSTYEVFGQQYAVLDSAKDFTQTGVASWYGSKFHGRATASGEIYDMHRLTAAHKHLPLPTFARVSRVDNGKSIVVKINDRGPFVGDRIIDLSFAAAAALDMLDSGKAEVFVESLSHHESSHHEASPAGAADQNFRFLQVGAFGESDNARALVQRVGSLTELPVQMDFESAGQLYRVLVGPLTDQQSFDVAMQRLESLDIEGYQVQKSVR